MELPNIKILDESNKILRQKSKDVTFPLDDKLKKLIDDSLTYLEMSQMDEYIEKYNLRAGMGLSFVQIGILKRIFVISEELDDGTFKRYTLINPKVISRSEELIYVGEGEGCLSINRYVEGIVPRNARITVEAYDVDGNKFKIRVREDIAIAFQHELDHLDGILFVDKIDKNDPYKDGNKIKFLFFFYDLVENDDGKLRICLGLNERLAHPLYVV